MCRLPRTANIKRSLTGRAFGRLSSRDRACCEVAGNFKFILFYAARQRISSFHVYDIGDCSLSSVDQTRNNGLASPTVVAINNGEREMKKKTLATGCTGKKCTKKLAPQSTHINIFFFFFFFLALQRQEALFA